MSKFGLVAHTRNEAAPDKRWILFISLKTLSREPHKVVYACEWVYHMQLPASVQLRFLSHINLQGVLMHVRAQP